MKYFLCILLVGSVCGENHDKSEISISSAQKVKDEKVAEITSDQNAASGNVNSNNYNEGNIGGLNNYYRDGFGNYFGKDIEEFWFDKKWGDNEKFERSRGNDRYFGNDDKKFGDNEKFERSRGNNRYFGNDDKKFGDTEKFERSRENYRYFGNDDKMFGDIEKFERRRGYYRYFGYDDGNPDIHGRIQRPCQAYDLFCIRKFFAEHSQCKISGRQVPEPLFRAQATFNLPCNNISATLINTEYKGLKDGRVEEFYIDKVTDNLVLTLDFDTVSYSTKNLYLKYYLQGKEPIVTRDSADVAFLKVSTTVVIPKLKDLKLERAEIVTHTSEPFPLFFGGPRLGISTDPDVPRMYAQLLATGPVDGMEILFTEGVFYASNFIQYNICDFGLKVL